MMSVKPFYIRITDNMTPQMVQDAFDKCVDAGAIEGDCVDGAISKHEYQDGYEFGIYELFGVSEAGYTRLYNTEAWFGGKAQEITLDQIDEWLGLEGKQEWKNGDSCIWNNIECIFIGISASHPSVAIVEYLKGCISVNDRVYVEELRKPETKQQREERE